MRLPVDEALSWRVAEALRAAGHDVVHVRDSGLVGASDRDVLTSAGREQRIVVTQDTDFGVLVATAPGDHATIILLRTRDGRPESQAARLIDAISLAPGEPATGAIIVVSDSTVRIRRTRG